MTKGSAYTRAQLQAQHLVNSWDIAKAAANSFFISYSNDTSRSGNGMRVQVVGIGFKTDPNAAWFDDGCKTFECYHGIKDKATAILAAQAWALEAGYVSDYVDWERDPFNGWHPQGTIARAIRASKRKATEALYNHEEKP